jgi:hypothetical protein
VEGVFDSPSRLWTSQGTSENRAELQFFITTRTLAKLPHAGKIKLGPDDIKIRL